MKGMRVKGSEVVFCSVFFIFVFLEAISQTKYSFDGIRPLQSICLLVIPYKILYGRRLEIRSLLLWLSLILLSLVIAIRSHQFLKIMSIILFMFAAKGVDEKKMVRCSFWALTIVLIMAVAGVYIGILPHEYVIHSGNRIRYYLGFAYTTFGPNFFIHAVIMWVFLKKKNISIYEPVIILLLNYLLYYFTDTRAVFYEVLLLVGVCWIMRFVPNLKQSKLRFLFAASYIVSAVISIISQLFYRPSNPAMFAMNALMNYRISLGHRALEQYGVSLLGQFVQWHSFDSTTGDYFYVDSSYLNIAIVQGVVLLVLLIIGFTALMRKYINENNSNACIALLFIAIHSITDPQLYLLLYNPFLFVLGKWVYDFQMPRKMKAKFRRANVYYT